MSTEPNTLRERIDTILLDHQAISLSAATDRILAAVAQKRKGPHKLVHVEYLEQLERYRDALAAKVAERDAKVKELERSLTFARGMWRTLAESNIKKNDLTQIEELKKRLDLANSKD